MDDCGVPVSARPHLALGTPERHPATVRKAHTPQVEARDRIGRKAIRFSAT
ncbi:hypothetical protein [Streptomyces europaeiscabiei]|uniref:Transposase n=1 Tax=Streptomyces europaeiscabiei TaxID=146819 RepID=A0ABU4NDN9_9ACTN|nr:hypothetical protein [Streptomyces europaeiscabiei]MDX2756947.1 hypothetical protein [Streptomyces europaeiscabiei]MDX2756970.1 hypothetical protein [Streptomyces europaeiscabiei]MDX3544210.1 hypothetical protein [Streptomyces europaeiscabiei]MDX3552444.1 hypothetical protein [Streptomyces europaeiscabiei]MDX3665524.1 hypothetical protein [Streptomyces europaeiscabiei]